MASYFSSLNYSLGDEDAALELALLPERAGHVLAVAGSGGRVLPLLAKQPRKLTCVDISPSQVAFTRLRLALLRALDRDGFVGFMGYRPGVGSGRRRAVFNELDLPSPDRALLRGMFDSVGWRAPIYLGRFERTLRQLARVNQFFTGRAGRGIFRQGGLDAATVASLPSSPCWAIRPSSMPCSTKANFRATTWA